MWKVWDKVSNINNETADSFLAKNGHLYTTSGTIYIKEDQGKITQVESKSTLANLYNLDITLDDMTFIEQYQQKIDEMNNVSVDFEALFGKM